MENLSHEESHWDNQHGILPWLVDGLKVHHPNCRLSIPSTKRQDLVLVLGFLAQSSTLYSLTITLLEWPRLRKLSLTDPTNFSVLMRNPINLRSLCIGPKISLGSIGVEDVEPWLCCLFNSQRLEELDVSGCTAVSRCITPDILNPLKSTLRPLKINGNEDQTGICKRKAYSVPDLECFGNTMGKLEHLSLDLNYEREWMRTSFFRQSLRWEA